MMQCYAAAAFTPRVTFFTTTTNHNLRFLVVAGARLKHEILEEATRAAAAAHPSFRILDVHGEEDEGVGVESCRESAAKITACGVPVEFRTYPTNHHVLRDDTCRADVRAFLQSDG